jgi:hypothetical protein
MSHLVIWAERDRISGTPNGQAISQLRQATQRGLSDDCTTPSSVLLMASAGQTSAQVGLSQCMQTVGTVAVVCRGPGSPRGSWDTPRCVSHSAQAASQARQPMQREGST